MKGRDAVDDDDGTEAFLTTYEYDKDDRTTEVQYEDEDHRVNYEYDAVGRVSKKIVKNGVNEREITCGYLAGGQGSGSTTPLVSPEERTIPKCGRIRHTKEMYSRAGEASSAGRRKSRRSR